MQARQKPNLRTHADPPPQVVYDPTGRQYETEKQLGRGGFAICWLAQQTDGINTASKTVALKIVKSKMEPRKLAQKFVTELQLHSKLQHHPNIVEFHRAFSFQLSTYVVLEVCTNGSIADCLKKRTYLTMPEIRRYVIQTCGAVKYLHMRNVVHRDLKTGNLFLDQEMNVKVGDFGLAAVLVGPHDAAMRRTTMCGTPSYIAPEVLEKSGKGHNEKVDIWAIGIIAYTLAVGKAPFHASKPEEVLIKVAKGEYSWPDLGKHENDISDDLRRLVSQILVDENSRPSLDAIVSHPFFKMGYLPDTLANNAIISRPKWTVKPPNPATLKRGYTEGWYKQCKASGVGEYAPGEFFSVVGDSASSSIYRECEREAEARKMPIVPMPGGALYTPFISNKGKGNTGGLEYSEDRELHATSSHLVESSVNTKYSIPGHLEEPSTKKRCPEVGDFIPMHACVRRPTSLYTEPTKTARRPAAPRSNIALQQASVPAPEPVATKRSTRLHQHAHSQPVIKEPEAKPKPPTIQQRPIRTSRTRSARTTDRVIPRSKEQVEAGPIECVQSMQTMSRNVTRAESAKLATFATPQERATQITQQIHDHATESKTLTATDYSCMSIHTDPATIVARAEELRNNIITALASSSNASFALRNWRSPTEHLPFVSRWVDYSKKHGIGYMLADGSVGVVLNHTADKPVTHAVVDHGYKYLKTASNSSTLKDIPFTFLTQADDGSLEKVTMPEADRKHNSILWARFARYMCKHLKDQASTLERGQGMRAITIVRFYQRIGNVSIWGFSNGCFQFNFPDHTKIVLSADGKRISFTALPLPAISHIATHATDLPTEFMQAREVFSGTIYQLLYGTHSDLYQTSGTGSESVNVDIDVLALTAANVLPAKLRFVAEVVGYWVSGGGLGCKPEHMRWQVWKGTTLEDAGGDRIDWLTVGRFGGDAIPRRED